MSKHPCFFRGTVASLTALLAVALTAATASQLLGREAARLDGFTQPDGTNAFALELKPSVPAAAGPREVVILVDTAASQTGDYRAKSLATLKATLGRLSPDDRVKLLAFDTDAAPLTQGFVAPGGPEMAGRWPRWSSAPRWAPATWKRRWRQQLRIILACASPAPRSISATAAAAPTR